MLRELVSPPDAASQTFLLFVSLPFPALWRQHSPRPFDPASTGQTLHPDPGSGRAMPEAIENKVA